MQNLSNVSDICYETFNNLNLKTCFTYIIDNLYFYCIYTFHYLLFILSTLQAWYHDHRADTIALDVSPVVNAVHITFNAKVTGWSNVHKGYQNYNRDMVKFRPSIGATDCLPYQLINYSPKGIQFAKKIRPWHVGCKREKIQGLFVDLPWL